MDKGIRPFVRAKFLELVPNYTPFGDRINNAKFRADVIGSTCEAFTISHASAATQYNEVFKEVRAAQPELLVGLGRPEDKKGGRKRKQPVATAPAETPADQQEQLPAPDAADDGQQAALPAPDAAEQQQEQLPAQVMYTVKKKSDDTVVAEGLTQEQAQALVDKARAAKKAALYMV